jgi:hypothetical protein
MQPAQKLPPAPPPSDANHGVQCPLVGPPRALGTLKPATLDEASGLAASASNAGVLWTHNDSGDDAYLYAIDESGESRTRVKLVGAAAVDWEDLALAPCPDTDTACLYAGDIGDNFLKRERVQVYWTREPLLAKGRAHTLSVSAKRVDIRYEDGPHDAETLLVDPLTRDLFIVAKGALLDFAAPVGVYRVSAEALRAGQGTAKRVAELPMGPTTGGDVAPDGSGVIIRNYVRLSYWPRAPGSSLAVALQGSGCELPLADIGKQGEAVAFLPERRGYVTVSEGAHATLYFYPFVPENVGAQGNR